MTKSNFIFSTLVPVAEDSIEYNVELKTQHLLNVSADEVQNLFPFLLDKDLSTMMELSGLTDWLSLDLGDEDWRVGSVKFYTMFYSDPFYCPILSHPCLWSESAYKVITDLC